MKRVAILLMVLLLSGICAFQATAEEILYMGEFPAGSFAPLRGSWQIVLRDNGVRYLELNDDFRARSGPDLKVYFSKLPLERIGDYNAGSSSTSIKIAPLKRSRGEQEYALPRSLDLTTYSTWIVHCERYSHFWDGAELMVDKDDMNDAEAEGSDEDSDESTDDSGDDA